MKLVHLPEFKNTKAAGLHADVCEEDDYVHLIWSPRGDAVISGFPGCCGIAVLHELDYSYNIGEAILKDCEDICRKEGFGQMIYTTITAQRGLRNMLFKNGWEPSPKFRNPKTGNYVTMYTKTLTKQKRGR